MPGAEQPAISSRPERRGVRSPRHVGQLAEIPERRLHPWMAHPLRPGESLVGVSLQGEAWLRRMVQLHAAPLTWAEVGMWIVPVSSLGDEFIELIVASPEERLDTLGSSDPAAGVGANTVVGAGGHLAGYALQARNRPWAGEIGSDTGTGLSPEAYVPYVSHSTWKVADTWYDVELGDIAGDPDRRTVELYDNPPAVSNFIRSTSLSGIVFDSGTDDLGQVASITELVERISLLTKTERSFAEYLAGFGINPMRAAAIPRPVFIEQVVCQKHGSAQLPGTIIEGNGITEFDTDTISGRLTGGGFPGTGTFDAPMLVADIGGLGSLRAKINRFRTRNMFVSEPSVLLGTFVWYGLGSDSGQYTHHMDMAMMTQGAHWGDVAFGGVDETDFLNVADLYTQDGNTLAAGADGLTGSSVMNLLNLYINGDHFSNSLDEFRYRGLTGQEHFLGSGQQTFNGQMSAQLHIATDLVGG